MGDFMFMQESYEINKRTKLLIPESEKLTHIYEEEDEFIVPQTTFEIIDNSCKFFGSSYDGRFKGTKALVGYSYKSPIIIEDSNRIIFFPTTSPRLWDCSWIAFNNIKNYIKGDKTCELILKNNRRVTINMSYNSLENQILRASKLWCAIEKNSRIINN